MRFNPAILRDLMKQSHMSQTELARQMGLSRSCICRILAGKRFPSSPFILGLRKVFPEYEIEYFFSDSSNVKEESA